MATMKKPVVYDDTNNKLAPIDDGNVLEPSVIPVSAVEGNVVKLEEDGLAVTPSSLVSEDSANLLTIQDDKLLVEPQTIVSEDANNVVTKGTDGGAYINQADFENVVNQLIETQVDEITVVSTDQANVIAKGTDGGAYINQADFVNEVVGMIKTQIAEADHVSKDEGNLLRTGSDGLAFADGNDLLSNGDINLLTINEVDKKIILTKDAILKRVADDLVNDDDALLKAEDGKIVSEVCISYEPLTGTLKLTGVDGEVVCETTVPSQATALKSVEFVTTKPDAEGESVSGTYTVTVQLRDILLGWLDPVSVNIEATKGSPTEVTVEIDAGATCGGLPSGMVNARAWFDGQESAIYAGSSAMAFAFADGSVLSFTSYKLNEEGTGYTLTGTFTPAVGVATGAWLHFIFELTDDSICELYVDVSYLIDIYTGGNGIDITDNVVSAVGGEGILVSETGITVDPDWLKVQVETYAPEYTAGDGIEISDERVISVDEEWLKTQVELYAPEYEAGTGIVITETTVAIDEEWLDDKLSHVTAEVNAGNGIEVDENNTVSAKAGTGIVVDENGISVDETWLGDKMPSITDGDGITITVQEDDYTIAIDEAWLDAKLAGVAVTAGNGIEVGENNTVSAKAGTGIVVDENGISVDETWLGDQMPSLKNGDGITITVEEDEYTFAIDESWLTDWLGDKLPSITNGDGIIVTAEDNEYTIAVDPDWIKSQVEVDLTAGTGITITEGDTTTVAIDEEWLDAKLAGITAQVNAGDGIEVAENNTVSAKAGTGIVVDSTGISVDEEWLDGKLAGSYYDMPLYFDTNNGTYEWGEVHAFTQKTVKTVELVTIEADGSGTSGLTLTMDYDIGTSSPMTITDTSVDCTAYADRAVVFRVSGISDQAEIAAMVRFSY